MNDNLSVENVYCPWPDISPQDRVLHHYIRELKRNSHDELKNIISGLDEKEARSMLYNHALWARDEQIVDFNDPHTITLLLAGRGFGKDLVDTTPIFTDNRGWITIGEIQIGDTVFDERGEKTKVTNVYKPSPRQLYKFTFSDGAEIVSSEEHDWVTWTHPDRKSYNRSIFNAQNKGSYREDWVTWRSLDRYGRETGKGPSKKTTREIVDTLTQGLRCDTNHSIPNCFPLKISKKKLEIDPYILGLWLGDGSSDGSGFACGEEDSEYMMNILDCTEYNKYNDRRIRQTVYRPILKKLNLYKNKHIPEKYLYSSPEDRLQLLRGLMDSDGYCGNNSHVEFCNTNRNLADGVLWLSRSLGEKPVFAESRATLYGKDCGAKYRVTWKPSKNIPFNLPRKAEKVKLVGNQSLRNHQRIIVNAEKVDYSPTTCITVDSDNHMFLAGKSLIPTHNSYTLGLTAKRAVEYYGVKDLTILAVRNSDLRTTIAPAILSQYDPSDSNCPEYISGKSEIRWPNGANAVLKSAESGPDATRGLNNELLLCDEIAFYGATNEEIITQSLLTLRLGMAKAYMFTTPKATPVMIDYVRKGQDPDDDYVKIIRGSTMDNKENLSKTFMDSTVNKYKGTRLERTEIYGELLLDNEGAIFSREVIGNNREHINNIPEIIEVGIGVDLALTTKRTASSGRTPDKTGIVVSFLCEDGNVYVAHDHTGSYTSEQWGMKILRLYGKYSSQYPVRITVESNTGGVDLLTRAFEETERGFSSKITFTYSVSNKLQRAMPYSLLSEKGQIKFLENDSEETDLEPLIDELCSYDGTGKSPDRMDAFVFSCMGISPNKRNYTSVSELLI